MNKPKRNNILIILIAAIVIVFRIYFLYANVNFSFDTSLQVNCALNAVHGNGFVISQSNFTDLSKVNFSPLVGWPLGYPVILATFSLVFRDVLSAIIISDSLFLILLICSVIGIFKVLKLGEKPLILLLGFYAITPSLFYNIQSADLIALAIFYFAIFIALKFFYSSGEWHIMILSIVSFAPATIRYTYGPLAMVIPLTLIVSGIYLKNIFVMKKGIWAGSFVLIALLLFTVTENFRIGDAKILTDKTGFYFQNLIHFCPFPFDAFFISTSFVLKNFIVNEGIHILYKAVAFIISLSILLIVFKQFIKLSRNKKEINPEKELQINFYICGFLSALTIMATMSFFSIKYNARISEGISSTFVEESSYFLAIMVFFQIIFFTSIFDKSINRWLSLFLKAFCIIVFIFAGIFFINKSFFVFSNTLNSSFFELHKDQLLTCKVIDEIKESTELKVIYIENDPKNVYLISSISHIFSGSSKYYDCVMGNINTTEPVIIVITMPRQLSYAEKEFIVKYDAVKILELDSKYVFKISLNKG